MAGGKYGTDGLTEFNAHPFQCLAPLQWQQPGGGSTRQETMTKLLVACSLRLFVVDFPSGSIDGYWDADAHGSKGTIIKLAISRNKKHVAVVTSEDKAVHVLTMTPKGIEHKNKRCMPKRPCAIAWNPDSKHILVADKFGDVYSLDLEGQVGSEITAVNEKAEPPTKKFKPSANPLTVHTKGNLRALENQIRMAEESKKKDKDYDTSMQPILGHVSMVTDLVAYNCPELSKIEKLGRLPSYGPGLQLVKSQGPKRPVIVTSDRDEHVRISRGLPQAHIIHSHCWGHEEFVSKLAVVRSGEYLISGGGDKWLGVWMWNTGELLGKLELDFPESRSTEEDAGRVASGNLPEDGTKPAVSGIWSFETDAEPHSSEDFNLVVALEGVTALKTYTGSLKGRINKCDIEVPGNVLDAALFSRPKVGDDGKERIERFAVVSIDNLHKAGSITEVDSSAMTRPRLRVVRIDGDASTEFRDADSGSDGIQASEQFYNNFEQSIDGAGLEIKVEQDARLADVFYGIENLRKRAGATKEEADE